MQRCLEAVRTARNAPAPLVVTHGPGMAAWVGLFALGLGVDIPILAHSFNFRELPGSLKRNVFRRGFSRISKFVVFSTFERDLYADAFGIPRERFDVVLWGVRTPEVDSPETRFEPGDYVCAIGGNGRDYRTLCDAAKRLPDVPFVFVVRPESLGGMDVPPNVKVHVNLPLGRTMNVLLHSRLMALPLLNSQVPCGHVTLVAAMHLNKPIVVTDSVGVHDYMRHDDNCLLAQSGSGESLARGIERLWKDPALALRLAANGQRFAAERCTEDGIVDHFRGYLLAGRATGAAVAKGAAA